MAEQTSDQKCLFKIWRILPILLVAFLSILSTSISLQAQTTSESGAALLAAGTACLDGEEFPLAVDLLSQAVAAAGMEKDRITLKEAYYNLAQAKFWLAEYRNSNEHLYRLLNDFSDVLNREDSIVILRFVSQNHYYMGNYDIAHELSLERLREMEKLKDSLNIARSYQTLSEIETRQKDYETALKNVQISSQIFERFGREEELSFNMDLMGDIFHNTGKYEEALAFKIMSCQITDTTGSVYNNAYCNHTIALTLSKLGRYDEAISLYKLALASWERASMPEEIALTRACLGETFALAGQCNIGILMIDEALKETEELGLSPLKRDILEKQYQTHKHCGKFEAAFDYMEKYKLVNDSLNDQNTKVRIASLNNNYDLEKKNVELAALKQKEQVRAQYIALLLISIILLIGLAVFIYNLLKKQRIYSLQLDAKSKQIEKQYDDIYHTNAKLTLANNELEQFAYLASHDLKTPLRTIGNYSSLITRRYSNTLDADGITFLKFITDAAKHMNALLEDIFAYSKVGSTETEIGEVNLQEKFQLTLFLLHETIEDRKAKIRSNVLPTVVGNPTQLYQLMQNLLDNALKFIPKDRTPEVEFTCSDEGEYYHFTLSDNGIGIPENKQEEVFTIFKRLHSKDEYLGTGIGLALCKKIIEKHGGRIWITSDGKTGSSFHFTLKKATIDSERIMA